MTTNTASGAADLAARLRNACTSVRSKSYPLADLIPLMQQAADALASTPAQPAAQQGVAYAALPDLIHVDGEIWSAIIDWKDAERGEDALQKANKLDHVLVDQLRAFADATHALRASYGQAYPTIGDLCARIKAADDAAADRDYMLDSNDCIAVLRGEWKGPLTMDKPERASHGQAPAQAAEPVGVVVPCYTPSGKRVALYSAKQDLPIGTKLYAAPKPSPTAQADSVQEGDVVAYLDVGANGYLDLGSELSEDALQQLPKGRHALVIAGTYGIDGYVAAPQPSPTAQADSVQEDAMRYRWLREGNDAKHGAAWHVAVNLYGCEWDAAIDAARKQGASHDR